MVRLCRRRIQTPDEQFEGLAADSFIRSDTELLKKMFHAFVLFCLCWWRLIGVFGSETNETQSVMEGDSVTLNTDVTDIHEDDEIMWNFGAEKSLIAQINRASGIFFTFPDERFRDRLKLDNQTGSLTITDITTQHAGDYKLEIIAAQLSSKTFSVSVYARLPTPNITRDSSQSSSSSSSSSSSQQNCSLLCSVVNVGHVTLSWYKGNSLLSSISVSDLSISLSLPLEVEYQDNNTYSCVINNPISNQTQHLDISKLCQIHSELSVKERGLPLFYILIPAAAAGSLLIVAAVVMCCICKKCRKTVQNHEEDSDSALCKPKTHKKKSKSEAVYENVPKKR
uniref:Ig-like domain-containing protein n=1 Tax=Cyprinus carpio carpio TaxID=630221 RepID=A0A9J7XVD1_CYPCA